MIYLRESQATPGTFGSPGVPPLQFEASGLGDNGVPSFAKHANEHGLPLGRYLIGAGINCLTLVVVEEQPRPAVTVRRG